MNLMKRMLCADLSQKERMYLLSFTHHDAFPVFKKMIREACERATAEVMQVDPTKPNYEHELKATQQNARAINEFAQALIESFNAHVSNAVNELEQEVTKEEKRRSAN